MIFSKQKGAVSFGVLVMCFLSVVLFSACPSAMSTSWGSWAKRTGIIPTPTADNVADLVDAARGDKDFAKDLLGKLKEETKKKQGEEKAALQGAGISAAAAASGLDTAVVSNASKLLDAAKNQGKNQNTDALMDTLDDIFASLSKNDVVGISNDLMDILVDEDTFKNDYKNSKTSDKTTTDDILVAAMVLMIAEAQDSHAGNFHEYIDSFKERQGENQDQLLNEREKKALFLAGLLSGTDGMGDLLDGMGL